MADFSMSGGAPARIGKSAPGTKKATGLLASEPPKNWISGATQGKGGLHKSLGIPQGKKIPATTLNAAAKRGGKVGKQARLAKTLEGLGKK